MSADNGIYIGHFDNGYRVIHAQAIENIYEGPQTMRDYFWQARLLKTLDEAYEEAKSIVGQEEQNGYSLALEYGIQILELGEWPK